MAWRWCQGVGAWLSCTCFCLTAEIWMPLQILRNLIHSLHSFQLTSCFEILHSVWQQHCCVLCKISKRLDHQEECSRQLWFHEIWFRISFRIDGYPLVQQPQLTRQLCLQGDLSAWSATVLWMIDIKWYWYHIHVCDVCIMFSPYHNPGHGAATRRVNR